MGLLLQVRERSKVSASNAHMPLAQSESWAVSPGEVSPAGISELVTNARDSASTLDCDRDPGKGYNCL